MIIPYQELSAAALRGVIREFVTRDGTELTDAEAMMAQIQRQLEQGKVIIIYDPEQRTCNIMSADAARATGAGRVKAGL